MKEWEENIAAWGVVIVCLIVSDILLNFYRNWICWALPSQSSSFYTRFSLPKSTDWDYTHRRNDGSFTWKTKKWILISIHCTLSKRNFQTDIVCAIAFQNFWKIQDVFSVCSNVICYRCVSIAQLQVCVVWLLKVHHCLLLPKLAKLFCMKFTGLCPALHSSENLHWKFTQNYNISFDTAPPIVISRPFPFRIPWFFYWFFELQFVWKNLSVEPKHAQVRNCLYVWNMAGILNA